MRKLRGVAVVAAVAIAACYSVNVSSTHDSIALTGSGTFMNSTGLNYSYNFGTQTTNTTASFDFMPAGDDYIVDSYSGSGACNLFPAMAGTPPIGPGSGGTRVYHDNTGACPFIGHYPNIGTDCDYPFGITFMPQNGPAECTYSFHYTLTSGTASGYVVLTLDGSGNVSGISASPSMISLSAPVGTPSGPGSATVTNLGTTMQQGSAYVDDNVHYMLTGPTTWMLNGQGSSATYQVTCQSTAAGTFASMMHFQAMTGSNAAIPLSCTVTNTNGLTFMGSPVNFPMTLVGTNAMDQTVTASYAGTSTPITFTLDAAAIAAHVTMTPASPYSTSIGTGAPTGTNVGVVLHWTPQAAVSGSLGKLNVMFGSASTITFPVQINGQADSGNVATNPTSIDFGAVCVGTVPPKQLDIYNTGGADVMLSNISPPGPPFTISPMFTGANIQHGHGNDLITSVMLNPTTEGDLSASATLNLQGVPGMVVPIHATAVGAGVATTPGALAFGTTIVGSTSNRQQFAISNCGSGDLTVQAATITNDVDGTPSNDFRVASPSPIENTTIVMTKSQSIAMEMTPQTVGHKMATLKLAFTNGDSRTVSLDGSGAGADGGSMTGGGKERETYYACSTGQPVSLAPLGLALLALRRRRR